MKRLWCSALGVFIALPLVVLAWAFLLPAQYTETWLGELAAKRDLLAAAHDRPRIVFVGGSAVAFGVDSALLEQQLPEYETVNFGLYAALGTRVMLDLSQNDLRAGDIVIVMPEQQAQTLSDYLGAEAMWQAADGDFSALLALHTRDVGQMLGRLPAFAGRKLTYWLSGGLVPTGVYQRASFDENGDVVSDLCAANIMPDGYDASTPILFDGSVLGRDFCADVNAYVATLAERGVQVWYHFPPMNADAVAEGSEVDAYADTLRGRLDCPLVGDPKDCILESGWFYDTNFHLNASGKTVFTRQLARDIKAMLGDASPTEIALPDMPAPVGESTTADLDSTDAECFVYESAADGLTIAGLTDAGRARTALTLPAQAQGRSVTALAAGALAGSATKSVTVQSNIGYLPDGAFSGCEALRTVIVQQPDPTQLRVGTALLDGAPAACRIEVPPESYTAYCLSYAWAPYTGRLRAGG